MIETIFSNNPCGRPVKSTWDPSPRISFPSVARKQLARAQQQLIPQPRKPAGWQGTTPRKKQSYCMVWTFRGLDVLYLVILSAEHLHNLTHTEQQEALEDGDVKSDMRISFCSLNTWLSTLMYVYLPKVKPGDLLVLMVKITKSKRLKGRWKGASDKTQRAP